MKAFLDIQQCCLDATKVVSRAVKPGISEMKLADIYSKELAQLGITDFWYPTLICAGQYSGQPLTRRNHLPSDDAILRENDIVILDTTPLKGTVWGNWTITQAIGDNNFYQNLCSDIFSIVIEVAAEVVQGNCHGLKNIYLRVIEKAQTRGLESIDPRGNVGHNIFQVPEGQTVDKTPLEDRIFIDSTNMPITEPCLISLEPELARINPADGVRYGGKFQFIIPIGYGAAGKQLIQTQVAFYKDMVMQGDNLSMKECLDAYEPILLTGSPRRTIGAVVSQKIGPK
jgi:Xaa-Pro aminopeptidase